MAISSIVPFLFSGLVLEKRCHGRVQDQSSSFVFDMLLSQVYIYLPSFFYIVERKPFTKRALS
jgi:hypothetical protein